MKRINKIIKKAECIKHYLEKTNKDKGNIDSLIESLISYRDNIGEIPPEKMFIFSVSGFSGPFIDKDEFPVIKNLYNWKHVYVTPKVHNIGIKLIEFTLYISQRLFHMYYNKQNEHPIEGFYSIPPMILEEHIADAVFDVQTFKVNDVLLSTELINNGFRPITTDINFICDFE